MTRTDIIRMAKEACLSITPPRSGQYNGGQVGCDMVSLERFAALIAAEAREVDIAPEDPDADPGYCPRCAGSGEGQHDGSTCRACRGKGER